MRGSVIVSVFFFLGCLIEGAFGKEIILTCPHSGKGSKPIEFSIWGDDGFVLPRQQSMFLPLEFDSAKVETEPSSNKKVLSCVYNSYQDDKKEKKTVVLVSYVPEDALNCQLKQSDNEINAKPNRLVCISSPEPFKGPIPKTK